MSVFRDTDKAAEQAVIGAVLNRPKLVYEIELEPWHFFEPRWHSAWEAMRRMADAGEHIDETTVAKELERSGKPVSLGELVEATLTAAIVPEKYAEIVRDAWVTRQVAEAAGKVLSSRESGVGGPELLDLAMDALSEIRVEQPDSAIPIRTLVTERLKEHAQAAEARAKGERVTSGIPTGIAHLDRLMGGWQRGIVTIAAGRPGMGKSALGMTAAISAAHHGVGVHKVSLEDTRGAYTDRAISRASGVPADRLRAGELTHGDMPAITAGVDKVRSMKNWIVDDRSGVTAEEIVRSVRRSAKQNNTGLVVVDYVQRIAPPRGVKLARHEQLEHILGVLANAAKRDHMAYLVMAQLNRSCESRDDKRPVCNDLKESGSLEEMAKAVLMLYRPSIYGECENGHPYPESRMELLLRKNNHGPTGTVIARWTGETTRID